MFQVNINSISFRTITPLLLFFALFVTFVVYIARDVFSSAYIELEKEKIVIIKDAIAPSLSLNLSYGFEDAIDEIADKTLENKNVLFIQITNFETKNVQNFTNAKTKMQEYLDRGELFLESPLVDQAMHKEIGKLIIIYSNDTYEAYMNKFNQWLFVGVLIFTSFIIGISYLLYKSLKNLSILDTSLKNFNPKNPEKLKLKENMTDEISSISHSANIMIENIVEFLNESKQLTKQLIQSQKHLKEAQRMAKVGSWDYNIENDSFTLSDEYYRILHLKKDTQITYQDFLGYIDKNDYPQVINILNSAITKGSNFEMTYAVISKSGTRTHLLTKGKVRKKKGGSVKITAISMDITSEIEDKQTIEKLAYYDSLTGLANRALLKDRIEYALKRAKREQERMAVLFLDLDHFKLINDTLGHSVGDGLLIHISNLLQEQLRESDTLSRLGGDEFVILLPSIHEDRDVYTIAQKIQNVLQTKHDIGTHQLYITSSIGIALYPEHGESADALIRNADTAMYEAKNEGRNNYQVYTHTMGDSIDKRLNLEQDLIQAVKTKTEIEVFYQPKIETKTGKISGAEALVRWRHPREGLIFPDEFIYLAESTGLMIELGNIIIEKSIASLHEWCGLTDANFQIAINLSARQFQETQLVSFITQMIQKYNVSAKNLEFEITESISMRNVSSTLKILNQLKEIGVSIAIDDFGTGHSSLSYLKKFPINTLKIDRSFITDIATNEDDKIIAQTIIHMACSLGFKTVAEGVETQEHINILQEMQCDLLQGYFFAKPLSYEDFSHYLKEHPKHN